jgi:DNA-directed RNA polymerase
LPRFAIANLRATFKDIPSDELPLRRQELLEAASLSAARAELEHAAQTLEEQGLKDVADSQRLRSDKLQAWMWSWSKDLTARLVVEIDALEKKTNKAGANRHPVSAAQNADLLLYLRLMKPEKLALVTILEVMRSCGAGGIPDGLKTLRGLIQVGKAVETEYRATTIQNILGRESQNVLGTTDSAQDGERAVHRLWRKVGKEADQGMTASGAQAVEAVDNSAPVAAADRSQALNALRRVWTPDWTQTKHVAVGAFLMNALVDTAKVLRTMTDEDGVEQ